jgi:protein-arginine kinase activator protein McsA
MNMRTKGQGTAPAYYFLCAACHKQRATLGRKVRMTGGMRLWVCAKCAEPKK